MRILVMACVLSIATGFIFGLSYLEWQTTAIESASRTSQIIQIDDKYYEVLPYDFEECQGDTCVLTIIPTNHGNRLYNMSTKNTSKYKQGFYDGLHDGFDMGWDVCYTSDKTKRTMGVLP